MSTSQQQPQPISKFVGKKIENTLCFNVEIPSGGSSAMPLSFAVTAKKKSFNIPGINNVPAINNEKQSEQQKQEVKNKSIRPSTASSAQQLQSLAGKDGDKKKRDASPSPLPLTLQERREQKKLEQMQNEKAVEKKEISMIKHVEYHSNESSDCEDFQDTLAPKQNALKQLLAKQKQQQQVLLKQQQQQQQLQQQQQPQISALQNEKQISLVLKEKDSQEKSKVDQVIVEEKRQADVEEMIRKSNLKFKNEKKMQEMETQSKLSEAQKLKDKLKKQEEEIRKRNQQKTQQFKDKKKKEMALQQQKSKEFEQPQQDNSKQRRKSTSRLNTYHSKSVQSEGNNEEDIISNSDRTDKPHDKSDQLNLNKDQFDLATKSRVRELMRKQKEEKNKELEEKQMKKLKLEMLRQDQLTQLSKAKIKTKEQELEEKRYNQLKRIGGGGGCYQVGLVQIDKVEEQQQNEIGLQKEQNNKVVRPKSAKQNGQQSQNSINNRKQQQVKNDCAVSYETDDHQVSESFLSENIRKSIRQLYPDCSMEELIQLEEEYRKEFHDEIVQEQRANSSRRKNENEESVGRNSKGAVNAKQKSIGEGEKNDMNKLLKLGQLSDIDAKSVRNPGEMIHNLKVLAEEIEGDLETNDKRFGVGKYKRRERSENIRDKINENELRDEDKQPKLSREEYIKQLYENAHSYFSPEEMVDFEKYLENHLVEGEYLSSSGNEGEDQDGLSESNTNYEMGKQQQIGDSDNIICHQRKDSLNLQRVVQQQEKLSATKQKELIDRQNHHLQEQEHHNHRGRSHRPKSCLAKEAKQKRCKTVTFDAQYVNSPQNTQESLLHMSPSIQEKSCKYGFHSFEDFKDKLQENKENTRGSENYSQNNKLSLVSADEEVIKFDRKIQEIKELAKQYSGDKKLKQLQQQQSLDSSTNPLGSLQSSSASSGLTLSQLKSSLNNGQALLNSNNLSKSHLKKQQVPAQQLTAKQQHISQQLEQLQIQLSQSKTQPKQEYKQQVVQPIQKQHKQQQESQDVTAEHQEYEVNEGRLGELDIVDFNENFDLDEFNQSMNKDYLKQLVRLDGLDLGQFFTNEKLSNQQQSNLQSQQQQQPQQYQFQDDDEDEEGLFAEDHAAYYQQYYEDNKQIVQTSEKSEQKDQITDELDAQEEFMDDDKLFALSATEMLKLAYH